MESPRLLELKAALENRQRIIFEMRDLCLRIQDQLQPNLNQMKELTFSNPARRNNHES